MALRGIDLKEAYARGENISALLRGERGDGLNSENIIEAAYDLQAGSYVASQSKESCRDYKRRYAAELTKVILRFGRPRNLLEAGVGEATTLSYVLQALGGSPASASAGVDLCWSRLRWARQWLSQEGFPDVRLAMATLSELPFSDNTFDVVYTSHSIEPNRGREQEILRELYRVTARQLVLLEPAYELAGADARTRMDHHGYCRDLPNHAERLGMKVLEHSLFPVVARAENPTALTIIEKCPAHVPSLETRWSCPECHTELAAVNRFWYCATCFRAYPTLDGLPCLRREKGIIASQLLNHAVAE